MEKCGGECLTCPQAYQMYPKCMEEKTSEIITIDTAQKDSGIVLSTDGKKLFDTFSMILGAALIILSILIFVM